MKCASILIKRLSLLETGIIVCFLLGANPAVAAKEKKKEQGEEVFALLVGTCFSEKGFSMRGVSIEAEIQAPSTQNSKKKWNAVTDSRGEFALRLPAGKIQFLVRANKDGYKPLEKIVLFSNDERQNIRFNMEPLPSKK